MRETATPGPEWECDNERAEYSRRLRGLVERESDVDVTAFSCDFLRDSNDRTADLETWPDPTPEPEWECDNERAEYRRLEAIEWAEYRRLGIEWESDMDMAALSCEGLRDLNEILRWSIADLKTFPTPRRDWPDSTPEPPRRTAPPSTPEPTCDAWSPWTGGWGNMEEARDAVYRVCDSTGCGTAFHIGAGMWLTNAHVVDEDRVMLYSRTGSGYPATFYWRNPRFALTGERLLPGERVRHDYAVLHSRHAPDARIWLAGAAPSRGDELTIIGYPGGRFSDLTVTVERASDGVVEYDGGLGPGSSGSPVVDERGCAYAINAGGGTDGSIGPAAHQVDGWPTRRRVPWGQ